MSIITTVPQLQIGLPVAYYIAKLTRGYEQNQFFCLLAFYHFGSVNWSVPWGWMILLGDGVLSGLL